MYLGNTYEESKSILTSIETQLKKWGKYCMIPGVFLSILLIGNILTMDGNANKFILIMLAAIFPPVYMYAAGSMICLGVITACDWMAKMGIFGKDVAVAAGTSLAISYVIGGKKTVKTSIIIWCAIIFLALVLGVYVGIFNYVRLKMKVKKGMKKNSGR